MTEKKIKNLKNEPAKKKIPVLKEEKKVARVSLPPGIDFALYPQPLSFWYKVGQLWWIIPSSYILKKLEVRKKHVLIELWNGKIHEFEANDFEAKYEVDKYSFRRLDISIAKTNTKIKIKEISPMYPSGREDFNDLITLFGAEKGMWTKIGEGLYEIAKTLKELKG